MREGARPLGALLLARVTSSAAQAITLFVLARAAGASSFGLFAFALGLTAIPATALGFGLNTYALRLLSREHPLSEASTLLRLRLATVSSTFLAFALGAFFVESWQRATVVAAVVYAASELVCELVQSTCLGLRRIQRAIVLMYARRLSLLLLVIAWPDPFVGLAIGAAFNLSLAVVLSPGLRARPKPPREVIWKSFPYWKEAVWTSAQQLDVVLLGLLTPSTRVGQYAAASRLTSPLGMMSQTLMSVLVPALSQSADHETRRALLKRARVLSLCIVGVLIPVGAALAFLIPSLLGPTYEASGWIIVGFVAQAGFSSVSQVSIARHYAEDRPKRVANAAATATTVGLVALFGLAWLGLPAEAFALAPALQGATLLAATRGGHRS